MSILLKQLQTLQKPTEANLKFRASLIFDRSEAADIDKETILSIGHNALQELIELDSKFEEFSHLFKNKDRNLMTAQENRDLNVSLNQFMKRLSPLFLSPLAFHALEWLVRGYSIHKMNSISFIHMILPYYDTKEYEKAVELLDLKDYEFLKTKEIRKLDLKFVVDMVEDTLSLGIQNTALLSFYLTFLTQYFNTRLTENDFRIIFPYIIKGIEGKNEDMASIMMMLLGFVSKKIQFEPTSLRKIVNALVKGCIYRLETTLLCFATLSKSQMVSFTKMDILAMLPIARFSQALVSLVNQFNLDILLASIFRAAISDFEGEQSILIFLSDILHIQSFSSSSIQLLIEIILEKIDGGSNSIELVSLIQSIQGSRFHEILYCMEKLQKNSKNTENLGQIFSDSLLSIHNGNILFLGLQHQSSSIRIESLIQLSKTLAQDQVDAGTISFSAPILIQRLCDTEKEIELVLQMPKLVDICPRNQLLNALCKITLHSNVNIGIAAVGVMSLILKTDPSLNNSFVKEHLLSSTLLNHQKGLVTIKQVLSLHNLSVGDTENLLNDASSSKSWLFMNFICEAISKGSKSNKLSSSYFLDQLSSNLPPMRVLSFLVLNKMLYQNRLTAEKISEFLLSIFGVLNRKSDVVYDSKFDFVDGILPSVFGTWIGKREWEKIEGLLPILSLKAIINYLPFEKEPWNVSSPSSYQLLVVQTFASILALSQGREPLLELLMRKHVQTNVPEFAYLSALSSETAVVISSINTLTKYISAQSNTNRIKDLQILLPLVLVNLSHESKRVRSCSIELLSSLKESFDKFSTIHGIKQKSGTIYGFKSFYGDRSAAVQYLQMPTAIEFSVTLLSRTHDILTDHSYLTNNFPLLLFQLREKQSKIESEILGFISSNIASIESIEFKTILLGLVESLDSPLKLKLLASSITNEVNDATILHEEYLSKLISCFSISGINSMFLKNSGFFFDLYCNLITKYETDVQSFAALKSIKVIQKSWFDGLDTALKQQLFSILIDLIASAPVYHSDAIKEQLRSIQISPEIVEPKLLSILLSLQTEQQSKRFRTEDTQENVKIAQLVSFLEFLQNNSLNNYLLLVPKITSMLDGLINFQANGVSSTDVEYCKQLILTNLESILRASNNASELTEDSLRVDSIVQCIRITDNPQTHNAALLLLATIGKIHPNIVLVNIMPVFTFMGANILRQDDNYSFQVVQKTLETIIPALIKGEESPLIYVKTVLNVFVNALEHVPSHRRLKLFTILSNIIGVKDYLGVLLILIVSSPILCQENSGSKHELINFKKFALQLLQGFDNQEKLYASITMMSHFKEIPDEPSLQEVPVLIDTSTLTIKTIRTIKLHILQFINHVLRHMSNEDDEDSSELYISLLQSQLMQIVVFGTDSKDKSHEKFAKTLLTILYNNVDAINTSISWETFRKVSEKLLLHKDIMIKKRAIVILQERLQATSGVIELQSQDFLKITEYLCDIVRQVEETQEILETKQHAMLCLAILAQSLGYKSLDNYSKIVLLLVEKGIQTPNLVLQASAASAIVPFISILGPRLVPILPKVVNPLLNAIEEVKHEINDEGVLLKNSFSCIGYIFESIPQFMSSFIERILLLFTKANLSEYLLDEEIRKIADGLIDKICAKVQPRILIPSVISYLDWMIQSGELKIVSGLKVFEVMLTNCTQADVINYIKDLSNMFLKLLDTDFISIISDEIPKLFVKFCFKLNEKSFKPVYLKFVDWAIHSENVSKVRLKKFYTLTLHLLQNLKSIFIPFFGIILDHSLQLITQDRDNLWFVAVKCLELNFNYDTTGFISQEKFDQVMRPLIQTFQKDADSKSYKEDMSGIVTIFGLFAKSSGNESSWKILNKTVLMESRSKIANVRWISVRIISEFYKVLGEEMLAFFPETIPFLAELLEDEDPEVETICQDLCSQIQEYLGEPINQYFKSS